MKQQPPLRAVSPTPAQLAADEEAPYQLFFPREGEERLRAALNRLHEAGEGPLVLRSDGPQLCIVASRSVVGRLAAYMAGIRHPAAPALRRFLEPVRAWRLRTRSLPLDRPHTLGILNLTEDSFSGDGVGADIDSALRHAEQLRTAGASLIDVGAESARADRPVRDESAEAELLAQAISRLAAEGHAVSVDTYKPVVAAAALAAGAEVVNDISGLTLGTGAAAEAARHGAGYILNYSYSVPKRRPDAPPEYADVVTHTLAWFFERLRELRELGLPDAAIAVDPGIAFGKSHDEDLQVIRRIGEFTTAGLPLLLAHSRKNFIGSVNGQPTTDRDLETHVTSALAFAQGVRVFRVHDVAGARRALQVAAALATALPGDFAPDAESWPWRGGAGTTTPHASDSAAKPPPGQRW